MPRGAFNRVIEVYHGPGSPTPGVLRHVMMGRVVPCNHIAVSSPGFLAYTHYITHGGPTPSTGSVAVMPPLVMFDPTTADVVVVPSLGGLTGRVVWNELIVPRFGAPAYERSYIFV